MKNRILFTDNGWRTANMGVGKVTVGTDSFYGLIGEAVVGKLMATERLLITNESGSFTVDKDSVNIEDLILNVKGKNNSLKIDPNEKELFQIWKGKEKVLYLDEDGNANFSGKLKGSDVSGATGTFGGLISGGSIDLGNGNFKVDKNGNLDAKMGTFKGNLDIGNSAFTVNTNGVMKATAGSIGGIGITSEGLSGGIIQGTQINGGLFLSEKTYDDNSIVAVHVGADQHTLGFETSCIGRIHNYHYKSFIDYSGVTVMTKSCTAYVQANKIGLNFDNEANIELNEKGFPIRNINITYDSEGTFGYNLIYRVRNDLGPVAGNDQIPSAGWVKRYVESEI